jgi:polynucleotide 5'-hydroxyl-kinase GRC3/NOL9
MDVSPVWQSLISEIVSAPGVAMVVGGVDAGKTRFCLELCSAGFEAGLPTAIVDADVGQSEVGAPGTIGMALVEKPVQSLSELKPRRLYFVGATSPADHALECCIGAKKMTDAALALGARLVVVDTTGLVGGWIGRKLKTCKVDLVRPNYLIGIERKHEIEHLLMPFSKVASMRVRRVTASDQAMRKPPELRTARRRVNYHKHFAESHGHLIRLDDVSLWNTWLGTGRPMKWQYMKFIEDALKCSVLHVEVTGRGIFIVSERPCSMGNRKELEEQFKTANITAVTGETFRNVLVGLADENANTINVGLLQAIDFKHRFLFVISPIKTISPVRIVQFGSIRVTKEGEELGTIKPGEM